MQIFLSFFFFFANKINAKRGKGASQKTHSKMTGSELKMHYVLLVLSDPPKWNGYTFDRIIHFQEKWTIVSEINDKINKIIIIAIVIVFTGVQDSSPFFALIPASLSGQFCVLQG